MATHTSPSARRKARRFALQALYQWQIARQPLYEIEAHFRAENDMRKVDVDYFHDLLHGVPPRLEELDALFAPALDRKVQELSQIEKVILRIGTFELLARIDVPYRVVINEGIELAKLFGAEDSFKYVNGVLDKVARKCRQVEFAAR